MKKNIHPNLNILKVKCSCGNKMILETVIKNDFSVDVCYKCHSFYTGKNKISSTKGRMEKLMKRFNKINLDF